MTDYLVLRQSDDGKLEAPMVHFDCPDAATAAAYSDPGEPCALLVAEWQPVEYRVRSEPVIEEVTEAMREAEREAKQSPDLRT